MEPTNRSHPIRDVWQFVTFIVLVSWYDVVCTQSNGIHLSIKNPSGNAKRASKCRSEGWITDGFCVPIIQNVPENTSCTSTKITRVYLRPDEHTELSAPRARRRFESRCMYFGKRIVILTSGEDLSEKTFCGRSKRGISGLFGRNSHGCLCKPRAARHSIRKEKRNEGPWSFIL